MRFRIPVGWIRPYQIYHDPAHLPHGHWACGEQLMLPVTSPFRLVSSLTGNPPSWTFSPVRWNRMPRTRSLLTWYHVSPFSPESVTVHSATSLFPFSGLEAAAFPSRAPCCTYGTRSSEKSPGPLCMEPTCRWEGITASDLTAVE